MVNGAARCCDVLITVKEKIIPRINDGLKNCLNGRDEVQQTEVEIEKSCARVRRHRFHCSREQPTCLSVVRLGDGSENCRNGFNELFFRVGRTISSIGCNSQRQDECSLLRQYIEQPSKSTPKNDNIEGRSELPFRSHYDTFSDLPGSEDETRLKCQQWWICPKDQRRCQTGPCLSSENEYMCDYSSSPWTDLINSGKSKRLSRERRSLILGLSLCPLNVSMTQFSFQP